MEYCFFFPLNVLLIYLSAEMHENDDDCNIKPVKTFGLIKGTVSPKPLTLESIELLLKSRKVK